MPQRDGGCDQPCDTDKRRPNSGSKLCVTRSSTGLFGYWHLESGQEESRSRKLSLQLRQIVAARWLSCPVRRFQRFGRRELWKRSF